MADLPSIGKFVNDVQEIFIQKKYGRSGVVIGSIVLVGFIIVCGFALLTAIETAKNILSPEKTLGISTTPTPTPITQSSPTPVNNCTNNSFIEQQWDISQYQKDTDGYYLPKVASSEKFLFPPMSYKEKIPADFKQIDIVYESTFQEKQSTTSATLHVALYDDNKNVVFTFDIPQPNRQLIGRKVMGERSETNPIITPRVIAPLNLPKRISFFGTNEVIINPIVNFKNEITYVLSGSYIDDNGHPQPIYAETPVQLQTVDPSVKEFSFVIGTGRRGKLKVKTFSICYK